MTTTTPTTIAPPKCPSWCEDRSNGHADDESGQKHGEWTHRAKLAGSGVHVEVIYVETPSRATIMGEDVAIWINPEFEGLTAGEATWASEALAKAAKMASEVPAEEASLPATA